MLVGNDVEMRNATQLYVTPLLWRRFKSSNIYANCFTPGCVVITDNTTNFLSVCVRDRERDGCWLLLTPMLCRDWIGGVRVFTDLLANGVAI